MTADIVKSHGLKPTDSLDGNMTNEERIEWIQNASFEDLLYKWRFEPPGSPWFAGEVGNYFTKVIGLKKEEVSLEEWARVSKQIGW